MAINRSKTIFGTLGTTLATGFAVVSSFPNNNKSDIEGWKQAMLNECEKLKEKMYVDDLADKNFNTYCTSNK